MNTTQLPSIVGPIAFLIDPHVSKKNGPQLQYQVG